MHEPEPSLDRNWHIGVCGWQIDGEHVTLSEAIERTGDLSLLREHRNCFAFIQFVLDKLWHEYEVARKTFDSGPGTMI